LHSSNAALSQVYNGSTGDIDGPTLKDLATSVPSISPSPYFSGYDDVYQTNTTWLDSFMQRLFDSNTLPELRRSAARTHATVVLQATVVDQLEIFRARAFGSESGDPVQALQNAVAYFYGSSGTNGTSSYSPFAWMLQRDREFGSQVAFNSIQLMNGALDALETISGTPNNETRDALIQNAIAIQISLDSTSIKTLLRDSYVLQTLNAETPDLEAWGSAYTAWRSVAGRISVVNEAAAEYIESLLAFNTLNIEFGLPENLYCIISEILDSNLRTLEVSETIERSDLVGNFGPAQDQDLCTDVDVNIPPQVLSAESAPAPASEIVTPVVERRESGVNESEFGVDEFIDDSEVEEEEKEEINDGTIGNKTDEAAAPGAAAPTPADDAQEDIVEEDGLTESNPSTPPPQTDDGGDEASNDTAPAPGTAPSPGEASSPGTAPPGNDTDVGDDDSAKHGSDSAEAIAAIAALVLALVAQGV
jgi:hypothetical protein